MHKTYLNFILYIFYDISLAYYKILPRILRTDLLTDQPPRGPRNQSSRQNHQSTGFIRKLVAQLIRTMTSPAIEITKYWVLTRESGPRGRRLNRPRPPCLLSVRRPFTAHFRARPILMEFRSRFILVLSLIILILQAWVRYFGKVKLLINIIIYSLIIFLLFRQNKLPVIKVWTQRDLDREVCCTKSFFDDYFMINKSIMFFVAVLLRLPCGEGDLKNATFVPKLTLRVFVSEPFLPLYSYTFVSDTILAKQA